MLTFIGNNLEGMKENELNYVKTCERTEKFDSFIPNQYCVIKLDNV